MNTIFLFYWCKWSPVTCKCALFKNTAQFYNYIITFITLLDSLGSNLNLIITFKDKVNTSK